MRARLVVVAPVVLLLAAVLVHGSGAGAVGRASRPLIASTAIACPGGTVQGQAGYGKARFIQEDNELDVSLRLQNALPNTNYRLFIVELGPGGCMGMLPAGNLSTDENGDDDNGALTILDPGVTSYFAVVVAAAGCRAAGPGCDGRLYASQPVPVTPSGADEPGANQLPAAAADAADEEPVQTFDGGPNQLPGQPGEPGQAFIPGQPAAPAQDVSDGETDLVDSEAAVEEAPAVDASNTAVVDSDGAVFESDGT